MRQIRYRWLWHFRLQLQALLWEGLHFFAIPYDTAILCFRSQSLVFCLQKGSEKSRLELGSSDSMAWSSLKHWEALKDNSKHVFQGVDSLLILGEINTCMFFGKNEESYQAVGEHGYGVESAVGVGHWAELIASMKRRGRGKGAAGTTVLCSPVLTTLSCSWNNSLASSKGK